MREIGSAGVPQSGHDQLTRNDLSRTRLNVNAL